MRTYRGTPGDMSKVTVESGAGAIRSLNAKGQFAWGDGSMNSLFLAKAILEDVLGNENEAVIFMMRFKHRVVMAWRADQSWTITDAEVHTVIEDIRRVERETAQIRAMVAREPPPVVSEGGAVGWKSAPDIVPNKVVRDDHPELPQQSNVNGLVPGRAYDELGILSVPCMVPPDSPFSVENLKKAKAKEA